MIYSLEPLATGPKLYTVKPGFHMIVKTVAKVTRKKGQRSLTTVWKQWSLLDCTTSLHSTPCHADSGSFMVNFRSMIVYRTSWARITKTSIKNWTFWSSPWIIQEIRYWPPKSAMYASESPRGWAIVAIINGSPSPRRRTTTTTDSLPFSDVEHNIHILCRFTHVCVFAIVSFHNYMIFQVCMHVFSLFVFCNNTFWDARLD